MTNILDAISDHTALMRRPLWLKNIRYNRERYGFKNSVGVFRNYLEDKPAIVLAAGAAFKPLGYLPYLQAIFNSKVRDSLVIIACDCALPILAGEGFRPDFVVSADAHPVVANFYRRAQNHLDGVKVVLPTTIHRDVVDSASDAGGDIYWYQAYWADRDRKENANFVVPRVMSIYTGGNVGTISFVIGRILNCSPIGLLGLEFSWSDETPLFTREFYTRIMREVNVDGARGNHRFSEVRNKRDGKTYVADETYMYYLTLFREMWAKLSAPVKQTTYNLTKGGIMSAPGMQYMNTKTFLKLAGSRK